MQLAQAVLKQFAARHHHRHHCLWPLLDHRPPTRVLQASRIWANLSGCFSLQISAPGVSRAASLSLFLWVPGQGFTCDTDHLLSGGEGGGGDGGSNPSPAPLEDFIFCWLLRCSSPLLFGGHLPLIHSHRCEPLIQVPSLCRDYSPAVQNPIIVGTIIIYPYHKQCAVSWFATSLCTVRMVPSNASFNLCKGHSPAAHTLTDVQWVPPPIQSTKLCGNYSPALQCFCIVWSVYPGTMLYAARALTSSIQTPSIVRRIFPLVQCPTHLALMSCATWYEGTAQLLSLTELKSHLF